MRYLMVSDWNEDSMSEIALQLNKDTQTPLFEQLYAFIKGEITSGHFSRNERLPSKRNLAESLNCSQNTIQAAYNQLVDEGYLMSRAKSGYYVAEIDGLLGIDNARQTAALNKSQPQVFAYDFNPQGVDFEHFPFSQWRKITKDVLNDYDRGLLRTGDPQGYPGLRLSIAKYLHHSRGVNCSPDQIVISSGTEFLLQLLIQLFDPTSVYAIENPGYEKLNLLFKSNRVEYVPLCLDEYGMKPEQLEKNSANVVCITPSHQFPTGRIMPVSRRAQLLNWAYERPERYIIEDDYDSEFRYSGKPIPSLQGLDRKGKVIYMGAFSKSLSPALRISYMVLPDSLMRLYHEKLSFYICPVPTVEQKILQHFVDEGHFERHLNRMRTLYKQKRELLVGEINRALPGAQVEGASAGLHFTLNVNNGMSEQELIRAAGKYGVKVYGVSRYYSSLPSDITANTLLLGFATLKIDEIPDAVSTLNKAWRVDQ